MPWIDHFGLIAPFYDRAIPLKHAERLIDLANLPVNGLLLDAGGGTGRVAQALQKMVSSIIVADLSSAMLRQVRTKNGLHPVRSCTEKLAFTDGTFDRIIMIDALHHVFNHQETVFELWRVLKPGGRMVIEEPDIRKFGAKLVAVAEKMLLMRSHFVSPEAICTMFTQQRAQCWIEEDGFNAWVIIDKQVEA